MFVDISILLYYTGMSNIPRDEFEERKTKSVNAGIFTTSW